MILRSVGIAGAIVVALGGRRGADAAARAPRDRRDPARFARASAGYVPRDDRERAMGAARPAGDGPSGRVLVPTLGVLLILGTPFLHVRFNAPDSTILPDERAVARRLRPAPPRFGAGRVRADRLAIRTTGPATDPANVAALYDYSRRLAADPRITRVEASSTSIRGLRSPSTSSCTPTRADRRIASSSTALARDHEGRPHGVHAVHAVRPEPRRGAGARPATCAIRTGALAPPAGMTVLVGGGAADVDGRRRRDRRRVPADGALHPGHDLPRPVPAAAVGRPAGQGAGDEQPLDRRLVRGARLDLPGRQPVGARSGSGRSASSRRPSR